MSPPSVPLFPADYFGDTKHLTCEQHGAYLQLLLLAWEMPDCSIPDDDKLITRMISISMKRWRAIKPTVMAFWTLENNRWTQRRLSRERLYTENRIALRRAAGSLGGRAKNAANPNGWERRASANFPNGENGIPFTDSAGSPTEVAKALKTNNAAVPNGVAEGLAETCPPTPSPLKKEKKEKEMNRVWVARDTPEWAAWQRIRRRDSVWNAERQQNGWWFKSQWPDPIPSPATKEAAE